MRCPKCGYVRRPEDRAPDYECPSCGVVYAKVIPRAVQSEPTPLQDAAPEAARLAAAMKLPKVERLTKCEDCGGSVSRAAETCPHCGLPFLVSTRPVAVTDVEMRFGSMVLFMFKWTLAAIPAAILVALFVWILFGLIGGLAIFGGSVGR